MFQQEDHFARGWEDGLLFVRHILMKSESVEDALESLDKELGKAFRISNRRATRRKPAPTIGQQR